ncbi:branched-chain amino acid ABC transporter permease [Paraburkholderia dipogonis]|uniref:Branched-chain amino acid ABC transporter permease n=1 Tax=Paraburkholderia dipogonis TaxID=1211383 RepID=A0A4Y8MGB2_9BURK|nr:branched-chain amino acid ABC transporter permease [Paraburkholderia dipogonis]TFE36506.1 branched-chain amino acid ABC transporter permease [Paraburkholderia dipogonis]
MSRTETLTQILRVALACLMAGLVAVPFALDTANVQLTTQALTMLSLAMLWNLLAGYANIPVIGQHALVGTGAYAFFGFAILLKLPIPLAILGAMVTSLLAGAVILVIIFRLRAAYLAVGSWVVAEVFVLVASRLNAFGGGSGIALPVAFVKQFGSSNEARQMTIYYLVLGTTLAILVGIYAVMRSRIGLAFSAMRDNEEGAVTAGVNLPFARALSYLIVSPFVGMVGVLVTLQTLRISHLSSFSMMDWTIFVLFVTVIGGIGSLEGPILGTVVFFLLRHFLQDLGVWYLIALGSLAVVVILIEPRGLWGLLRNHLSDDLIPLRHRAVVLSFKTEKETLNAS